MARTEIRITGYGGQGVVLSGYIIGRACAIFSDLHATMIQSFGPEARGSACSAMVSVQDTEVLYPYIKRPDIFVVMSGEGYEKFGDELKDEGILIYELDLVKPKQKKGQMAYGVPSTRIAESLGRVIVQNIVMMGFFTAVAQIAPREAMRKAVEASVPPGTQELNLKAFDAGVAYYDDNYAKGAKKEKAASSSDKK